jgi:predicted chitinase
MLQVSLVRPGGKEAQAIAAGDSGSYTMRGEERLLTLLSWPDGASIAKMMQAANWQQHSVRGLLAPKKAKEPGNTKPGDGFKFRGAGYLQITGRDSYRRHGEAIGINLTADSDLAAKPENSLLLACEEWKEKRANRLAYADDLRAKAINGGVIGLAERRKLLNAAEAIRGDKHAT